MSIHKFLLALAACLLTGFAAPVSASTAKVKACVERTGKSLQNATSRQDLFNRMRPHIHDYALGAKAYKRNWPKILEAGNRELGIQHYVFTLYKFAGEVNEEAGAVGKTKSVEVTRVTQESRGRWSSGNKGTAVNMPSYQAKTTISAEGVDSKNVTVIVVLHNGKCKFVDLLSDGVWFGEALTSTQAMFR